MHCPSLSTALFSLARCDVVAFILINFSVAVSQDNSKNTSHAYAEQTDRLHEELCSVHVKMKLNYIKLI